VVEWESGRVVNYLLLDKFPTRLLDYFLQSSIENRQSKGGVQMALMRAFARVDEEGRISIPDNIRKEVDLKEGQLVEIKLSGPKKAQYVVIHKRESAR